MQQDDNFPSITASCTCSQVIDNFFSFLIASYQKWSYNYKAV